MPTPYHQLTPRSCGVDCLWASLQNAGFTHISREAVARYMNWVDSDDVRADLTDNPAAHADALDEMGVPWRWVTCGDIKAGRCKPLQTVILIHASGNPIIQQHWVLLDHVISRKVLVQTGGLDGENKPVLWEFNESAFDRAYSAGTPAAAYEIGVPGGRLSRWWRCLARGLSKVLSGFRR